MKTKTLLFTAIATIVLIAGAQAQNVNIPDAIFKAALVANSSINTNMDAEIQVSEASVFNGSIYLAVVIFNSPGLNNITDLTGIEAFVSLISLDCSGNALTSLDVSACTALTYLYCRENFWSSLTSLNVSGCTALINLDCSGNSLSSLDVSANTALTYLDCSGNSLSSLDVSANTALTTLYCYNNNLTSLNVKNGNNMDLMPSKLSYGFLAHINPNLNCIEVDNAAWSNIYWANDIDSTAYFSENCSGVGITDNNESNAPIFYPNPTTGSIYLSEPANITLSDLSGKLLLEQINTNQLDISDLPAGMYFLNVGENKQHIFKVLKE